MFSAINPWILLGAVLSIVTFSVYISFVAYNMGENAQILKCNNSKQETINANINIKNNQDKVIRSDDASLIDSLRDGSF